MGHRTKGFTLVELVLVITLLGILAVVALPRFFNMSVGARQASRDGVLGSVRSGLALWRANDLVTGGAGAYPGTLDAAGNAACAAANPCFGNILDQPLVDGRWTRVSDTQYSFNDGAATITYTYAPLTGAFQ
jgi:prepilin-type N-terminal cleavage/methylation domain-containing protein